MSALGLRREQACFRDRGLYSACRWTSAHMGMAFPCTCTPLSDVHARIGIDSRRFVFKIRLQGAIASAMSSRPSIVPPGLENRSLSSAAASATRQPCSRNGDGSEADHSRLVSSTTR